jgi:hypothetical protein
LIIKPNSTISVTRSGGIVKLNNRRIEVVNASYKRLMIGKEYLLFVNYLSDSDSFQPSKTLEGSFEIQGDKIKRLRSQPAPYQPFNGDLASFLSKIREIAQNCSQ